MNLLKSGLILIAMLFAAPVFAQNLMCDMNEDGVYNIVDLIQIHRLCKEDEPSACVGQVCGTFTPDCDPNVQPCYCFKKADGGANCGNDFSCSNAQPCASDAECPTGKACVVDTCCGGSPGVCAPTRCTGVTEGAILGVGGTASGQ